jgi:hypothetical protein
MKMFYDFGFLSITYHLVVLNYKNWKKIMNFFTKNPINQNPSSLTGFRPVMVVGSQWSKIRYSAFDRIESDSISEPFSNQSIQ